MKRKEIAIVAGGDSSEYEISIKGADFFMSFLNPEKYNLHKVIVSKKGWWTEVENQIYTIDKNDFSFTKDGTKTIFDLAIIIIHGTPGENGILQSYFELIDMPYLTGGVASSVISFDKEYCKAVAKEYGVKVADGIVLHREDGYNIEDIAKMGFPIFIKPNASGSSYGVSKVSCTEDIEPAITYAYSEDDVILIEKAIIGREIACGAYKLNGEIIVLPATEIITDREFFDYEAKYLGQSNEVTPAENLSQEVTDKLHLYTKRIYRALRCKDFIRVDFIVKNQEPYMIEINNVPGMSSASIIPQQIEAHGLKIAELYDQIIEQKLKVSPNN